MQPQAPASFLEIVSDYFPVLHSMDSAAETHEHKAIKCKWNDWQCVSQIAYGRNSFPLQKAKRGASNVNGTA
jgi:hypothetical protein